jgi:hypothetical protein
MPGLDGLLEDGCDRWIPLRAQRELAHHHEQLRLVLGQSTNPVELGRELLARPRTWAKAVRNRPMAWPTTPLIKACLLGK